MEQKENVKPVEFENLFANISQDSLDLERALAKPPHTHPEALPQAQIDTQTASDDASNTTTTTNANDQNQNQNNNLSEQAPDTTLGDISIGPALTTGPPSFESEDKLTSTGVSKQESQEPAGDIASEKKYSIDTGEKAQGSSADQISLIDSGKIGGTGQAANSADSESSTVVHEAEKYADDLARKLLDDTNDLVRSEARHSATSSTDTTTNVTMDDKNVESQAGSYVDSLITKESVEENKEGSRDNEERVQDVNDREQKQESEVCGMDNKTVDEPHPSESLKALESEPELGMAGIVEIGGSKLDNGDDLEYAQTNGNDRENNGDCSGNSNTANDDQSATTAEEEAVEEVVEVTQQQDLDQDNEKPQEPAADEGKEEGEETEKERKTEATEIGDEEEEKVEEEDEEDIDDIVRRFERDTESEPSVSEKEQSFEIKEEKRGELIDQGDIKEDLKLGTEKMEFAKNYSDDLLMGQSDQAELPSANTGTDLADFELPPYSGSSSGSEPRQHSPVKRKSSSTTSPAQQHQASSSSSTNQVNVAPPDLTAVKNLLMSSYSKVSYIFHWKKPIETGLYFSIGATLIIALTFFSIISVVAYSALGLIAASSFIRIYKAIMKTLGKSTETPFDHVWDKVLSINVSLSPDRVHQLLDASLGSLNSSFVYFKQVLLVEDKFATLKFGIFLYLLTYIGAWFNGMTLITITYLALFSVPVFYEKNKTKIDEYVNLATGQLTSVINMVTGKVSSTLFGVSSTTSSGSKKQN